MTRTSMAHSKVVFKFIGNSADSSRKQFIGVALITQITHVRNMCKKNMYNKMTLTWNILLLHHMAALKGKNLLPLGANSFPLRVAPILKVFLGIFFKVFPGCA